MIVYLTDNEDPVMNCPVNQTTTSDPRKSTRLVKWEPPIAIDNSGDNTTTICDPASGSDFAIGQTSVTCIASDSSGNSKSCIFYVDVSGKSLYGYCSESVAREARIEGRRQQIWG